MNKNLYVMLLGSPYEGEAKKGQKGLLIEIRQSATTGQLFGVVIVDDRFNLVRLRDLKTI